MQEVEVEKAKVKEPTPNVGTYVKEYFQDIPVMARIAKCESQFRQWDKNGEVLRGVQNPLDRGVLQINEKYHLAESIRLGYDILTLEGNVAYGRYLYEREGTAPWSWSKHCWQ